jgi:ribosomal-protein-alanine N-acetyltransferase
MSLQIRYLPPDTATRESAFELLRVVYEQQPTNWPMGGAWTRSLLKSEMEAGSTLGAFDAAGRLQGYVLYRSLMEAREISLAVTNPQLRRTGVMKSLFQYLFAHLKVGDQLWLEVHELNEPAFEFYKGRGFKVSGERPGYYRDGGKALLLTYCHQ